MRRLGWVAVAVAAVAVAHDVLPGSRVTARHYSASAPRGFAPTPTAELRYTPPGKRVSYNGYYLSFPSS